MENLIKQKIVIDNIIKSFDEIFSYLKNKILLENNISKALELGFEQIDELAQDGTLEHTLLRKYIIFSEDNFKSIVGQYLENQSFKKIVLDAFKLYKTI